MANDQDDIQFDIGAGEEEATVEITQDGKEATVVQNEDPVVEQSGDSDAEDRGQYSEKVKKRIDKLTARLREHQRREAAAVEYADALQRNNEELQRRYTQSNVARVGETKGRLDTQIVALKNVIKRAREENDIDTETEAQQRLTTTLWEQQRLVEGERQMREQPVAQPQPRPVQRPPVQVDVKAEDWAEQNPWFGNDIVMTNTVRGIHVELVKNEGFDPSSDEYYDEINRRMRNLFPQQFQGESRGSTAQHTYRGNRSASTVAPATRSSGVNTTARRTVRLEPSEVAIAKKLGVPLEEYAKYVKR